LEVSVSGDVMNDLTKDTTNATSVSSAVYTSLCRAVTKKDRDRKKQND
jgi:hypothetical protein